MWKHVKIVRHQSRQRQHKFREQECWLDSTSKSYMRSQRCRGGERNCQNLTATLYAPIPLNIPNIYTQKHYISTQKRHKNVFEKKSKIYTSRKLPHIPQPTAPFSSSSPVITNNKPLRIITYTNHYKNVCITTFLLTWRVKRLRPELLRKFGEARRGTRVIDAGTSYSINPAYSIANFRR